MIDPYPFFAWLDGTALAGFAKANGGVFALVQVAHLLALTALGGCVLVADMRLLGAWLRDVPSALITQGTDRLFDVALVVAVASGVFMSTAVATKLPSHEMFWAKMAALALGVVFVYAVRRPLLRHAHDAVSTATKRLVALASLALWFTVAASGRWIGFS